MTIFVTGGAGFIGSEFIRQGIAAGHRIVNFDKLTYAGNLENLASVAENPKYSMVRGESAFRPLSPTRLPEACDAVVHFAAESHVDRSILSAEEFVRTNVLGTQVMLDIARHRASGASSTSRPMKWVAIWSPEEWFREDSPLEPNSPYAASKTAAEHFVRAAAHTFGIDTIVTRTSNNYGPYQFPEKLLPLAISNAIEDRPIPVYGDGMQVRDWVHVADNCRALFAVLEHGKAGRPITSAAAIQAQHRSAASAAEDYGEAQSLLTRVSDRLGHDRRYAVDFGKITAELGWIRKSRSSAVRRDGPVVSGECRMGSSMPKR